MLRVIVPCRSKVLQAIIYAVNEDIEEAEHMNLIA